MKQQLHILAVVRKPELWKAATLVFQTLRVGFPEAQVHVWGNALGGEDATRIKRFADAVGGWFQNVWHTSHDAWIESLLQTQSAGFWICDTDVVFANALPVQGIETAILAGRFEPEFMEEWTGTRHVERLHPAVMWMDAPRLRAAMRQWMCRIPELFRNSAEFDLVRQHFVPVRNAETLFYDTCAGLWHALGGRKFTEEENGCFEHLHCGTYADLVDAPSLSGLREFHEQVYANPRAAVGAQVEQAKYYESRKASK